MNIGIEDLAYCMKIIREAAEALDRVAVPRVAEQFALAERIELLAQQRDARVRELERETAGTTRLSAQVYRLNEERGALQRLLTDAGSPTNEPSRGVVWLARELSKRTDDLSTETERADTLSGYLQGIVRALGSVGIDTSVPAVESSVIQLIHEQAQLRRMHDGVSVDLDRERREKQDALGEAAARELKLIEARDIAVRDAQFFKSQAADRTAEIRDLTKKHEDLSERYRCAITERNKAVADAERPTAKIKRLASQQQSAGSRQPSSTKVRPKISAKNKTRVRAARTGARK